MFVHHQGIGFRKKLKSLSHFLLKQDKRYVDYDPTFVNEV